jgi:hypothetical protein
METTIVAQPAYDQAYGQTFPAAAPWGGVRYLLNDNHIFNFQTIKGEQVSVLMKPKGIHDEMGASFDAEYGRMSGNLAIEIQPPLNNAANLNLYAYSDVPTEIVQNSTTPDVQVDVLGQLTDGTQIWNVSHNGVDTHPIHFHIFDVQLISRLGWDNQIRMPMNNELGWLDTVKISPLMDTVVAVRPVAPLLPFGVPESIRPLNPALQIGSQMGFSNVDPVTGQAYVAPSFWGTADPGPGPSTGLVGVHNVLYNFGWEYVWHCHILSHEEMDMMRAIILQVATLGADPFVLTNTAGALSWVDPTPVTYTNLPDYILGTPGSFGDPMKNEIGFNAYRSAGGTGAWTFVGSTIANKTSFDASATHTAGDTYVVEAYNANNATYSSALGTVLLANSFTAVGANFDVTLTATILGPIANNTMEGVDFYNGTTLIGTIPAGSAPPYTIVWPNVSPGVYSVTAQYTATGVGNNQSLYAVSLPSTVNIGGGLTLGASVLAASATPTIFTVCDSVVLTTTGTGGGNAPYTSQWFVDGVALLTVGDQTIPPLLPGAHAIKVLVTDQSGSTGSLNFNINVSNAAPVVSAGGPYSIAFGGTATLTGAATDANACDTRTVAWDINNDGVYDYFRNPVTLKYSVAQALMAAKPATAGAGPVYTIRFKATDNHNVSTVGTTTLTLGAPVYGITTTALPVGTVNAAYSLQLTAVGGTAPYTWSAFGLPAGMTLSADGLLSATTIDPLNIGAGKTKARFPVSIINVDAAGASTSKVLFLWIQ